MSDHAYRFKDYGGGGDYIGARRARHAFRWCVVSCLMFTVSLWVAERFLRYEHPERLFLCGITKPPEQGRVFLREAVLYTEERRELPIPKYLQALAAREESDRVFEVYQKAYEHDPGNAAIAMRYGCRLFAAGKTNEARLLFAQASQNAPKNALPCYLEASALPWCEEDDEQAFRKALALIAKTTNSSAKEVVYPAPVWFSDLPPSGYWYAKLCRDIVFECSDPLRRFMGYVKSRAGTHIEQGQTQYWDSWLRRVHTMGQRFLEGALASARQSRPMAGSAIQAQLGLWLQAEAVQLRKRISEVDNGKVDEALVEQGVALANALAQIEDFENTRGERIAQDKARYGVTIRMALGGVAFLYLLYLLTRVASRFLAPGREPGTIPHTRVARTVFASAGLVMLGLLCLSGGLRHASQAYIPVSHGAQIAWWCTIGLSALFGVVYPFLSLPSPHEACRRQGVFAEKGGEDTSREWLAAARKARRAAAFSLLRRYYAVLFGIALCSSCCWVVLYRAFASLYPWQVELLATGLESQEAELVQRVLAPLL